MCDQLYKCRKAYLHTEVFKNLGIDERTLPNHDDTLSDNLKIARELIKIARFLLEA